MTMDSIRLIELDRKALLRAGASSVLALDPSVVGGFVALTAHEPATSMAVDTTPRSEEASAIPVPAIAVVTVQGPLAQRAIEGLCGYCDGYDRIAARVTAALRDPAVGAVILRIDSPGGDVAGLDQCAEQIAAARAETQKPLHVYCDELVASAAYRLAVVADTITAPPSGRIGSIGCIAALLDETEALAKEGLKITLIRSPQGKAESHPSQPLAELAEARTKERVQAVAARFIAVVAELRGLDPKTVEALNGAVLGADEALAAGLIDAVGSFSSVIGRAAQHIVENAMDKALLSELETAKAIVAAAQQVTGQTSPDAVIGALQALKSNADKAAELAARVEADKAAQVEQAKASLIEQLQTEQKLTLTQLDWARSLSVESLQAYAAVAVPFGPARVEDAAPGTQAYDPAFVAELTRHGVTLQDFLAAQAHEAAAQNEVK